jgi:GT2 family glycosyltransferase
MPTVGIVLVNWNTADHTLRCVESVRNSRAQDYRIYVVDNASADDSVRRLTGLGEDVRLIANARNDGWAGGVNIGVRAALADACDHIFLLNNDAEVREDTIDRLLAAEAALGPAIVLGCVVVDRRSGEMQFFGTANDPRSGTPRWFDVSTDADRLANDYIDSSMAYGAALFARSDHFRRVGLFDERLFLNFEETDWCLRARRAGLRCVIVRHAVAPHFTSASIGGRDSPLQHYFLCRNELLFGRMHCSPRQRLVIAGRLARALARTIRAERGARSPAFPRSRAAARGMVDYVLRRFGDCPAHIRRLNAAWRERIAAEGPPPA